MSETSDFAAQRRAEIVAHANSIGITEEFLSQLVEEFYARVRLDPQLKTVE